MGSNKQLPTAFTNMMPLDKLFVQICAKFFPIKPEIKQHQNMTNTQELNRAVSYI